MSNNSAKQRVTQLMEWLPTLSSKRKGPIKSSDTRQRDVVKSRGISSDDVRIKNGPNGRR